MPNHRFEAPGGYAARGMIGAMITLLAGLWDLLSNPGSRTFEPMTKQGTSLFGGPFSRSTGRPALEEPGA